MVARIGEERPSPLRADPATVVPGAVPGEVSRRRLRAMLDHAPPIVVVSALSGHGATTVVAQWARESGRAVDWSTATPGASLCAEPSSGTLVVDGLHPLPGSDCGRELGRMLETLAERAHVVVTTDVDLDLPITAWRARGMVRTIDEHDLAFDDREALELADLLAPGNLSEEEVAALNRRVAGWPIALATVLRSIRDAAHPEHRRSLIEEPHGVLHDHVLRDIVGRLEPDLHQPTMSLAVAECVDPDAGHLLSGSGAADLVDRLRRERIVLPVRERPGSVQFHPVVRQVLLARLRWADPARYRASHRRMAELCASRGRLDQACRHLVAAGERDASTRLVVVPSLAMYDAGDRAGAAAMLGGMTRPDAVEDPGLAFDLAIAWVFAGSSRQARLWCDRAERLVDPHDALTVTRNHATRILVHMLDGDMDTVLVHLDALEALEPRARLGAPVEGFLVSSAVRAAFAVGDLDRGRTWLDFARITASNPVFALLIDALHVQADLLAGSLAGLAERIRRVTAAFARQRARPHLGQFEALVVQAEVELAGGRLASGAASVSDALVHAELLGYDWARARASTIDAQLRLLSGDPSAALSAARATRLNLDHAVSPMLLAPLDAAEARALIRLGRLGAAHTAISAMVDGPHRRLVAAEAAFAERHVDAVPALLDGAESWRAAERLAALCLLGTAVCGDEGERILQRAVAEAAALGWVSPFLGHGPRVDAALRRLPLGRLHPALAIHLPSHGTGAGSARVVEPLTPRERDVLALLPSHLSNAEIARRLNVSVNTVKSNLKLIYQKLSVSSRSAAVEAALAHGLL